MVKAISKYVSVVVPVYNEEENIVLLHKKLGLTLEKQGCTYEIIYVDDGSIDGTFSVLAQLTKLDSHIQIVRLKHAGQTAAMAAGVEHSSGAILVFMDGDLQNDPLDIPRLLARIEEGYDVVSGWRKERKDACLSRKVPSWLANRLISKVTGLRLHDYGCTLKAYRREVFAHVHLYGEMHRFIPAYAALAGASITELEVSHYPRAFGTSKYGISRTGRVIVDLITLKFLSSFGTKPGYAFGIPGLFMLLLGALSPALALGQKALPAHMRVRHSTLLALAVHFSTSGILCIIMGLLAEVLMRTYYESQGKLPYIVKEVIPRLSTEEAQEVRMTRWLAVG